MRRKTRLAKIRCRESCRGRSQVRDCDWERDLIRAKREIDRNRVRGDLPEKKIEVKVRVARGIWSGPQERGGERERDRVQGELLKKMIEIRAGVVRERE